ncbi:hypothetical protein ACFQ0T_21515 [Kitasatospora gansuensis]
MSAEEEPESAMEESEPDPAKDPMADEGLPPEGEAADQLAKLTQVFQVFAGPVDARNSTFGDGSAGADRPPSQLQRRGADTGRLTEEDLAEATTGFARPEPYDRALAKLEKHQVVELWGPAGTGRRAAAIVLLDELLEGPVYLLRPTLSLRQLAGRDYKRGCGYVLSGRLTDGTSTEDSEHLWRRVRTTVRDCGAHLVVTSAQQTPGSPWRVPWERPEPRWLLLAALGDADVAASEIEAVLAGVPSDFRPQDLREVARRLAAGAGAAAALEQFSLAASATVAEWFEAAPPPAEVLEVTALAFTEGTSTQEYEHGLAELARRMAESVPSLASAEEADPDEPVAPVLPASRAARARPDGLTRHERLSDGVRTRTVVVFRERVYRERVLAELNDRYDVSFWRGVTNWLGGRVRSRPGADPQVRAAVAAGLAELARLDVYEVEQSCLRPWSAGQLGWAGQQTAVLTLWLMCRLDDTLAPVALSVAEEWATDPSQGRRWAAAVAFTGELGLRYPHEAAGRLLGMVETDARLRGPPSRRWLSCSRCSPPRASRPVWCWPTWSGCGAPTAAASRAAARHSAGGGVGPGRADGRLGGDELPVRTPGQDRPGSPALGARVVPPSAPPTGVDGGGERAGRSGLGDREGGGEPAGPGVGPGAS